MRFPANCILASGGVSLQHELHRGGHLRTGRFAAPDRAAVAGACLGSVGHSRSRGPGAWRLGFGTRRVVETKRADASAGLVQQRGRRLQCVAHTMTSCFCRFLSRI